MAIRRDVASAPAAWLIALAVIAWPAAGRSDDAVQGSSSQNKEELADENDDTPASADGADHKSFPIASPPKLPLAGKSIKVGLPEKDQGSSLLWKPRWRRFSTGEWVVTAVSLSAALASLFVPVRADAWSRPGFLFDEPARNTLRVRSEGWRLNVRDTSDVLLSISTTYPFLVDSLMVAWWHRGSSTVATQMTLMNAEAMGISAGIQGVVSALVSRERPFGRNCEDSVIGQTQDCLTYNRYRSFFSGHSSQAFVSAMLTCAHHANIPLYGTRGADRAACVTHIGVAAAIATMRVLADVHYVSDVITGAIVGSAVGLAVPYLLHYRGSSESAPATKSAWSNVRVVPMPTGIAITGVFG